MGVGMSSWAMLRTVCGCSKWIEVTPTDRIIEIPFFPDPTLRVSGTHDVTARFRRFVYSGETVTVRDERFIVFDEEFV